MRKLNVSLLRQDEVDQAFPLVQANWPEAELEGWRSFARARIAQGSGAGAPSGTGVLAVWNEQACIVGIGAFVLSHDLVHGPVLLTDHFSALDIMDQASIARALENSLERIARHHGCTAIHTTIATGGKQDGEGWLCGVLQERGHRIEGLQMCRLVPVST